MDFYGMYTAIRIRCSIIANTICIKCWVFLLLLSVIQKSSPLGMDTGQVCGIHCKEILQNKKIYTHSSHYTIQEPYKSNRMRNIQFIWMRNRLARMSEFHTNASMHKQSTNALAHHHILVFQYCVAFSVILRMISEWCCPARWQAPNYYYFMNRRKANPTSSLLLMLLLLLLFGRSYEIRTSQHRKVIALELNASYTATHIYPTSFQFQLKCAIRVVRQMRKMFK